MPKTLLLADDSVTIQKVVGISFANEDVVLLSVDNGSDAIARAAEARPDIVLADVVMPGKNGYEVCEAIKASAELRHIPVLLLTGTFEAFDEDRARRAGADGHITKPFEAQALVDQVNQLLARAQQPAQPSPPAEPEPAAVAAPAQARPAEPAPPPPAEPAATSSDDAYDFFDDDLDHAGAADAPVAQTAQTETIVLSASQADPPRRAAEGAPDAAEAAARDAFALEERETTLPRTAESPDRSPEPEAESSDTWPSGDEFESALAEDEVPSLEVDDFDAGAEAEAPDLLAGEADEAPAFGAPDAHEQAHEQAHGAPREDVQASRPGEPRQPAPEAARADSEGFDFELSETPREQPAQHGDDPLHDLELGDLGGEIARETVVDPESARDYDVSSSDLGDSYRRAAASAPVASPQSHGGSDARARSPEHAPADVTPATEPAFAPAPGAAEPDVPGAEARAQPAPAAAPAAAGPLPATPAPLSAAPEPPADAPFPPAPQHAGDESAPAWRDSEAAVPAPETPPEAEGPVMELGSEAELDPVMELDAEAQIEPEPEGAAREPGGVPPEAPAAAGGGRPAEPPDISPVMRERIHDSLEKIAWEAFGDLSDTITRQIVQRIEEIAWEVIPQMAEALIREEIRRLKGEGESDS